MGRLNNEEREDHTIIVNHDSTGTLLPSTVNPLYANKDHHPEGEHQRRGLERSFPSEYLNTFSTVTAGDPRNQQRDVRGSQT